MEPPSYENKAYSAEGQSQPNAYPPPAPSYGYPPPQQPYPGPPAGGAGYYPPPQPQPMGYPPPQQQQQQQQSVVVVNAGNPAPMIVQQAPVESYGGYQALACVVFWFCNWLFGLIAWILALVAESTKLHNPAEARRLGKASLGMSISGIIVSIIIIAIVVGVSVGGRSSSSSSYCSGYTMGSKCYYSRAYIASSCSSYYSYSSCCTSYYGSSAYYYSSYCYYNY